MAKDAIRKVSEIDGVSFKATLMPRTGPALDPFDAYVAFRAIGAFADLPTGGKSTAPNLAIELNGYWYAIHAEQADELRRSWRNALTTGGWRPSHA